MPLPFARGAPDSHRSIGRGDRTLLPYGSWVRATDASVVASIWKVSHTPAESLKPETPSPPRVDAMLVLMLVLMLLRSPALR